MTTKFNAPVFVIIILIVAALSLPSFAGTIKGKLVDDAGEVLDGISVYVYGGEDPERYTATPGEKERAIYTKTDSEGNFSLNVPDAMRTFNLKAKVDTTFFKAIELTDIKNHPGIIELHDALIQQYGNSEAYWVSTDTNASAPATNSHFTNRWEQSKARGKGVFIYFPEPKIEPLKYDSLKEEMPEIRGLPRKNR